MNSTIRFLSFDEAVSEARKNIADDYVGISYMAPYSYLGVYIISVPEDASNEVNIEFEGGELFDELGEEDFYSLSDAPDEAKLLVYVHASKLGDGNASIRGQKAEFLLQDILPNLSRNTTYSSQTDFIQKASQEFQKFWSR